MRTELTRKRGTCRVCGCTDADCTRCVEAQGFPCSWVDEAHKLCSRCADIWTLSLWQPWADEVVQGRKSIETRNWGWPRIEWMRSHLVGKMFAIHAAKKWDSNRGPDYHQGMRGCLIGTAILEDVKIYTTNYQFKDDRRLHLCPPESFFGLTSKQNKVGLVLRDPGRLRETIPCRGHQGFFKLGKAITEAQL